MGLPAWADGFLRMLEEDFVGTPAATATPTTTVHTALQSAAQAAENAAGSIASAAKETLDTFLNSKIGAVGTEVIDTSLDALIAEAESRKSTAPQAQAA